MTPAALKTAHPPIVIGHRGACGYVPEHTAAAYRLAVAMGADAVEPDVVATRDGVLVVRHENEISATTNVADHPEFAGRRRTSTIDGREVTGWFTEDFTWAELSTLRARERLPALRPTSALHDGLYPILRLRDVLRLPGLASCTDPASGSGAVSGTGPGAVPDPDPGPASGRAPVRVVVEFKHPTYFAGIGLPLAQLFDEELRSAGITPSREWLTIECFEKSLLGQVAALGVQGRRVYLMENTGAAWDLVARDGAGAAAYAEELTPRGLDDLAGLRTPTGGRLLDGISVAKSLLVDDLAAGCRLVAESHARDLEVLTYTLRPENEFLTPRHRRSGSVYGAWRNEFQDVLDTGVDGVFADHPDLARAIREREGAADTGRGAPGGRVRNDRGDESGTVGGGGPGVVETLT